MLCEVVINVKIISFALNFVLVNFVPFHSSPSPSSHMNPSCCPKHKYKPVTHVIFDLDGTILDTEKIYGKSISDVAEIYGKTTTPDLFVKIAGSTLQDTCKIAVRELELPITPEQFEEKFKEFSYQHLVSCEYMPGAERLIKHFHANNVPLAIATSSTEEEVLLKFQLKQDIYNMFHHIVCGSTDESVKKGKPAPDIFLICASRFRDMPNPVKCLVFEDSVNGMRGGLAAGMQVVLTPDPMVPYESWKEATMRLDNLDYFIPEFFNLPAFEPSPDDPLSVITASFISEKSKGGDTGISTHASEAATSAAASSMAQLSVTASGKAPSDKGKGEEANFNTFTEEDGDNVAGDE